jgi:hypothetical protein
VKRRSAWDRIICVLAIAAIWTLILGWAADVRWGSPWVPQQRVRMNANTFHVVMGAGVEDGTALRIGAIGEGGNALQSIALDGLRAEDFATLRYRFGGFPRTLELSLVFRRADAPDDVQVVTVPWPGDGWRSLNLRQVPGWRGQVTELGLTENATPQVVPESIAFRPFRFDGVELQSPSWRGSFGALYTSWFGYTPWALLSVSALGPQREVAQAPPPLPFVALASLLSLLAAGLILQWSRAQLLRGGAIAFLGMWALLDLRWLDDFGAKHELTKSLYAGKSWDERERLQPDQDLALAAEQVRGFVATLTAPHHLLVASDSKYTFLRQIYLLLPLNAAPLEQASGQRVPPRDTLFVLYRDTQWHYDDKRSALLGDNRAYPVEPVFESGEMHIYGFRGMQR